MPEVTDVQRRRTITLSNRRPVRINEAEWPVIATGYSAAWLGEQHSPSRTWSCRITLREHADGRALVYGVATLDTVYSDEQDIVLRAGDLVDAEADLSTAIDKLRDDLLIRLGGDDDPGGDDNPDGKLAQQIKKACDQAISQLPAQDI